MILWPSFPQAHAWGWGNNNKKAATAANQDRKRMLDDSVLMWSASLVIRLSAGLIWQSREHPLRDAKCRKLEITMSTTTRIPVEVYLRSSYEPDAEYVDGEIEERPMGKTTIPPGWKLFASGSGNTRKIGTCVSDLNCESRSLGHASGFPM